MRWVVERRCRRVRWLLHDRRVPSDVAYLVGTAIGGVVLPAVAAYVTLKIHKERLSHERRLEDLRALRQVAAEGAAILRVRPSDEVRQWAASSRESGDRQPSPPFPSLESVNVLGDYFQRLRIWFPEGHPVVQRWGDVMSTSHAVTFRGSDISAEDVGKLLSRFHEAKAAWFAAVRASIGPTQHGHHPSLS